MITQARLKEIVTYDGIFRYLDGEPVKCGPCSGGYPQLRLDGKQYRQHRLAFLYMTGSFPVGHVDHIDGNPANNSWDNLREVTRQSNQRNVKRIHTNTSGVTGVSYNKGRDKWEAYIGTGKGKRKNLGNFTSLIDAVAARMSATLKYEYHENHGRG